MFIYKRCQCRPSKPASFTKQQVAKVAGVLKLASVPSRLSILLLLESGPHCVCDIETHSKMSQTLISHHLADLTGAGLIESKKNGQFVDYNLTKKGETFVSHLVKLIDL